MTKRQWLWLIVALALFIAIGAYTAWQTNQAASVIDTLRESFYIDEADPGFPDTDFVARIDIEGAIVSYGDDATELLYGSGFSEAYILSYIDRLIDCGENVGILLYIDSPGGEMGASDAIYLKLMDYRRETGRPVFAYFGDTACSGAYYVAMAADEIWANRNCICVNIGVYIETYNLSGLFEKYGVEEIMIKSSENKGIGSIGQPWTEEQLAVYQSIVDLYYDQFLDVVAQGRGMKKTQVKALNDGREMLAAQALEAGFIDGIGRYEDYLDQVLGYFGGAELYEETYYEMDFYSIFDYLYSRIESLVPVSDGELIRRFAEENSGVVVMAYAG